MKKDNGEKKKNVKRERKGQFENEKEKKKERKIGKIEEKIN